MPFTVVNTFSELDDGTTEWHAQLEVRLGLVQKALAPVLKPIMGELVSATVATSKSLSSLAN